MKSERTYTHVEHDPDIDGDDEADCDCIECQLAEAGVEIERLLNSDRELRAALASSEPAYHVHGGVVTVKCDRVRYAVVYDGGKLHVSSSAALSDLSMLGGDFVLGGKAGA